MDCGNNVKLCACPSCGECVSVNPCCCKLDCDYAKLACMSNEHNLTFPSFALMAQPPGPGSGAATTSRNVTRRIPDDTPKTISMRFLSLSKPVFNKQNQPQSRIPVRGKGTAFSRQAESSQGKSLISSPKPVSLGRRNRPTSRPRLTQRSTSKRNLSLNPTPRLKPAGSPRKTARRKNSRDGKNLARAAHRNPATSRLKGARSKSIVAKKRAKGSRSKSPRRGRSKTKKKIEIVSKMRKKVASKKGKKGNKVSRRSKSSKKSSKSSGRSKSKNKDSRGRAKRKSGRRKPRGPPPTPVATHKKETQSMLIARMEKLNMFSLLYGSVPLTVVSSLRGYSSEPDIAVPAEARFIMKKPAPRIPNKSKSLEDILLIPKDYPELMLECLVNKNEGDFRDVRLSPTTLDKWHALVEAERNRFSFFDRLFQTKYVTDSMEVPRLGQDVTYLVEADEEDFSSKIDYGRIVLKTKHLYTGNFNGWYFEGPGRYVWLDGKVYQGEFADGVMHGNGTLVWPDGSIYDGAFVDGVRKGFGIYSAPQGYIYCGGWKDGFPHGQGTIWYDADGDDFYKGSLKKGAFHGFGLRQYKNGDRYVGNWANGAREGNGTMLWRSLNQMHRGQWVGGCPHGEGIQVWYEFKELSNKQKNQMTVFGNGRIIFKGFLDHGKRHGKGKIFFPNGVIYEGVWESGKQIESGRFTDPAGEILLHRLTCIEPEDVGFVEEIFDRTIYECLFRGLLDALSKRFDKRRSHNPSIEQRRLTDVCFIYMRELRLLYKRAGVLGSLWNNDTLASQNLRRGAKNQRKAFSFAETPMASYGNAENIYARLNRKLTTPEKKPVTRLGLWLLIGDCENTLTHVTMGYFDKMWESIPSICFQASHSPFEFVHFWQFLQCLVVAAFEILVTLPFAKSRTSYKPEGNEKDEPATTTCVEKEEKIINMKEGEATEESSSKRGSKNSTISKKLSSNLSSRSKKGSFRQSLESQEEVLDELSLNLSDDDFMDLPAAEDGTLGRPPSLLIEADAQIETDSWNTLMNERKDGLVGEDDVDDPFSVEVPDHSMIHMADIFEKFITTYLLKCFDHVPGKRLPSIPSSLPPILTLYDQFLSVNGTPVITGTEFLRSILPETAEPCSTIFWTRSKDILAVSQDCEHLLHYVQKHYLMTTSELLLEPVSGSDVIVTTGDKKLKNLRGGITMVQSQGCWTVCNSQSQSLSSHKSQIGAKEEETEPLSKPQLAETVQLSEVAPSGTIQLAKSHDESLPLVTSDGIRYCVSDYETNKPQYTLSAEREDARQGLEHSNIPEEQIFDVERELLKPDGMDFSVGLRAPLNYKADLTTKEVLEVLHSLYPEMWGSESLANLSFDMIFCDWLWALSLCEKKSAGKTGKSSHPHCCESRTTPPVLLSKLPLSPSNLADLSCSNACHSGDTIRSFQEVILPAFKRHQEIRAVGVGDNKIRGIEQFHSAYSRKLGSHVPSRQSQSVSESKSGMSGISTSVSAV